MDKLGLLQGLELSQLKDIYESTNSVEVLEYIKGTYGMSGLRKVNLNYAVGLMLMQLELEPELLLVEISSCNNIDDLSTIYTILYDILQSCIKTENSEHFEGFCEILNNAYLHHPDPRSREKVREFIKAILYFIYSTDDADDIARRKAFIPKIQTALLTNVTLTKEDVFTWLADFPELVKGYVNTYLEVASDQMTADEMPESLTSRFISFTTIIMLLVEYLHYMEAYIEETGKSLNIEQNLYDVLSEMIMTIEANEYPGTYSNFYDYFLETAYSGITKSNTDYLHMLRRFWTVWLLTWKSEITYKDGCDWATAFEKDADLDFYDTVMSWYSDIVDKNKNGLIHLLYHSDILDSYDANTTNFIDNRVDREDIKSAITYMIRTEKLDETFFTAPELFLEQAINEYFSSVSEIRHLNDEQGVENIDYSESLLDDISGG